MAVLDFVDNLTKDASLGMALADIVETKLLERGCALLERRRIRVLLGERSLAKTGFVSDNSLDVRRKLPSVQLFIQGELSGDGEYVELGIS